MLITAEFAPIQLGFGFTLLGVGGLLSVNRTLDTPALMAGVKTGAVNSILFPQDIVANINRIATDIKTIFPLAEGIIVAPMGKLGWGTPTLISLGSVSSWISCSRRSPSSACCASTSQPGVCRC